MGLRADEPLADLRDILELDFQAVPTSSYRVHLPDRTLDIVPDGDRFQALVAAAFARGRRSARALRLFWRLQAAVGNTLFRAAAGIPRLPVSRWKDLVHDFRVLGIPGILAAATSVLTVRDVLLPLGLDSDIAFRSLIAMLLQDTAQAGPETVPFANAAVCLQAYRLGMSRPRGGMKALTEGIGQEFARMGGDLRTSTLVEQVEIDDSQRGGASGRPAFEVVTRRRERLRARQVALNLPLDLAARLLGRTLKGRLARRERRSHAAWSAFTGYVAIDRPAVADNTPLFHQVLRAYDRPVHDGNNVLISLSAPRMRATVRRTVAWPRCQPIRGRPSGKAWTARLMRERRPNSNGTCWRRSVRPCPKRSVRWSMPSLPRRAAFSVTPGARREPWEGRRSRAPTAISWPWVRTFSVLVSGLSATRCSLARGPWPR